MRFLHLLGLTTIRLAAPAWGDSRIVASDSPQLNEHFNAGREAWLRVKQAKSVHARSKAAAVPAGASPCTGDFEKPSYQFSGFQFNQTTIPAGDRSMVRLDLTDVVNKGSTSCTTPYLQDPNTPAWNECDGDYNDGARPKTSFKYTAAASELEVNQIWICEAENKTHPLLYFSNAKVGVAELLNCVDDETQTICTVADEGAPAFDGEYVTPVWNSDEVDVIPPSDKPVTSTPWNPTPCIGTSFSYPNWDVQNFTSFDDYEIGFHLYNHGNNETVWCVIQTSGWEGCGESSTAAQFNKETRELSVNAAWYCSGGEDYPDDVQFRARGSVIVDPEPASSFFIKGRLTEPLELAPNVAPEGVNHPDCLEISDAPSWVVTSWVWDERWRDGYNYGVLNAAFHNPATGFNLTCEGNGEELNRDGRYGHDRWWGCGLDRTPFDDYRIQSAIKLDPTTEIFSIEQTWYCNGHEDRLPAKIKASGNISTTLDCTWNNDTAENTFIKTCQQTVLPLTVEGSIENRTELAPDAFFELAPGGYSCTIASVLATQWRSGFSSDTLYAGPADPANFRTRADFILQFVAMDGFRAVGRTDAALTPFLPSSDPGRWYDCVDDAGSPEDSSRAWARQSLECRWQLDLATGYMAINHTWFCDDKDPENPIIFTGYGSRFYDFSCYIYRDDDEYSCDPTGLNVPPILPTELSWKSVPASELKAQIAAKEGRK
ncbi:hypothetical protein GGR52DRAFT_298964 [Hypoxylon sp. FL1284]|nr:hypothetical protein GGR52DRAFT_298964 [Hypoxylon sp. FL1284]